MIWRVYELKEGKRASYFLTFALHLGFLAPFFFFIHFLWVFVFSFLFPFSFFLAGWLNAKDIKDICRLSKLILTCRF